MQHKHQQVNEKLMNYAKIKVYRSTEHLSHPCSCRSPFCRAATHTPATAAVATVAAAAVVFTRFFLIHCNAFIIRCKHLIEMLIK